jgi:hypothetical protein
LPTAADVVAQFGLGLGGRVQRFIDAEIVRHDADYVPVLSGDLRTSASETAIGQGIITYRTPYARRQWYENQGKGLRGKCWTTRDWADNGAEIIAGAERVAASGDN